MLSIFNNKININGIIECGISQQRMFDGIKNKIIDETLLLHKPHDFTPNDGTVGWYLIEKGGYVSVDTIGFSDRRDSIYNYTILISTHGGFETGCCENNPVTECNCGIASPCIMTGKVNKEDIFIDYNVPNSVIDYAIDTLNKSNITDTKTTNNTLLYIAAIGGLGLLYLISRK